MSENSHLLPAISTLQFISTVHQRLVIKQNSVEYRLAILRSLRVAVHVALSHTIPDSKAHVANMGPTWGRQDPGGPHVGNVNLAIWDLYLKGENRYFVPQYFQSMDTYMHVYVFYTKLKFTRILLNFQCS